MMLVIWTMFLRYGLLVCFLCENAALDQSQDLPVIESVKGLSAAIPCNVPEPLSDDEASLILWYRSDLDNPIYTLDVRGGPLKDAKHFPAPEIKGRANFDTVAHPPRLVLDPVQEGDRADYRCRVDLKRSRTLILHSRLEVIVLPGVPIIMDEHGQHLHDVVGPYDEGSNLIFICEVDGGQPSPEVTWWRGLTLLDDSFNVTQQGFVRNELVLDKIQREDWMAEFVCQASNTNATEPKQASLLLDMNLMPLSSRILPPPLPIVAGRPLDLTCETVGSRPRALTSWRLGEVEAGPGEALSDDHNATLSTLSFVPAPGDDGKELLCRSANPVLSKETLEARMVLAVQYPPYLNLTLRPSSSAYQGGVREGDDLKLLCAIHANPAVFNVTFLFEGRPLTTDVHRGVLVLNHTLFLQRARREHRGTYKCQAHNEIGRGDSNPLLLKVLFTPVCKRSSATFHGISPFESTELRCEVEADPLEVQFQWSFNSSLDIEGPLYYNVDSNASSLQYSPKTEAGYGIFMCWGTNALGTQKEPCVFKVVPAGPPESPFDCLIPNQTSTSVSVNCQSGYNGSLSQTFHLEVYNSGSEFLAHNLTASEIPHFEVDGLEPSTSYVLVLYASNPKGRSKSLALVSNTLTPPKRRTAREISSSFNPILGIIMGVLSLFIVSVIVKVLIVQCRRRTRIHKKEPSTGGIIECELGKKELEEGQDNSGKGPDIIPHSKDAQVFHLEGYLDDVHGSDCLQKQDSPPTEYIRMKYMHTVL